MPTSRSIAAGRFGTAEALRHFHSQYGLFTNRDRLYEITQLIFDEGAFQASAGRNRFYTLEQVEELATGLMLHRLGYTNQEIQILMANPEARQQAHETARKCMRELRGLTELASASA